MIITQITLITVLGTDIRQNFYKSFAFSILLAYTYICYILRKDFVITMSDFSQRLEKEIQNTGKTLCYLAEASGLQLDYISKMNKGKRIPKEENRLVRLLDAMECTASTKSDLLLLYRQEKMGKSQWQCMEELIHIIQQDVIEFPTASASVSISDTPNTISILDNEFAIYSWIRKIMISTSDSEIYLWTSEISSETFTLSHSDHT